MLDGATLQALGLTAVTMAFPFHNWLVMLEAVTAQEAARRARLMSDHARRRDLIADTVSGFDFAGFVKPQTVEQTAAGAFYAGF